MDDMKIEPETILFIDRKTKSSKITLRNISMEGRAFKIKTTKPKDYTVKPNMGIIIPMQQMDIDVIMASNNTPDHTHKFMIEVYKFDWRRSVSVLKSHLKQKEITPLVTYKLEIAYQIDEFKDTAEFKDKRMAKNYFASLSCKIFIGILFSILFYKIFRGNDF